MRGNLLRGIRQRLTYANVISTIALFAALTGGYAVAFSGSGTLQKGSLAPVPDAVGTTLVRSLTGIGSIRANCDGPLVNVFFKNGSGETMTVAWASDRTSDTSSNESDDKHDFDVVAPGVDHPFLVANIDFQPLQARVHLIPADGSKAPQASLDIVVVPGIGCGFGQSSVTVLALNTQQ